MFAVRTGIAFCSMCNVSEKNLTTNHALGFPLGRAWIVVFGSGGTNAGQGEIGRRCLQTRSATHRGGRPGGKGRRVGMKNWAKCFKLLSLASRCAATEEPKCIHPALMYAPSPRTTSPPKEKSKETTTSTAPTTQTQQQQNQRCHTLSQKDVKLFGLAMVSHKRGCAFSNSSKPRKRATGKLGWHIRGRQVCKLG